jgi:hypothetical protein
VIGAEDIGRTIDEVEMLLGVHQPFLAGPASQLPAAIAALFCPLSAMTLPQLPLIPSP